MKTITATDAKNHFGSLIDAMHREPVLITKRGQGAAVFISLNDAADTLLPELMLGKAPGYAGSVLEGEIEHIRAEKSLAG
jgi:prevent-host-death family protein